MLKRPDVKLGDEVQDVVCGIKGIAVAVTTWLNGCVRITIQPNMKKSDQEAPKSYTTDVEQCKILKKAKFKIEEDKKTKKKPSGGRPDPERHP